MVNVEVCGSIKQYEEGTTYEKIAEDFQDRYDSPIALVYVNGKQTELMKKAYRDCRLEFITFRDAAGHKTHVRTATLVLMKAVSDILGMEAAASLKVEFAIG
ncbi:MAG: nucleoside kinase, partial [Lachnospiraceae bacterium]|nr:nucleoside kinase [Lachnospiraceae bacterium]